MRLNFLTNLYVVKDLAFINEKQGFVHNLPVEIPVSTTNLAYPPESGEHPTRFE
jgi:hypothetical protein